MDWNEGASKSGVRKGVRDSQMQCEKHCRVLVIDWGRLRVVQKCGLNESVKGWPLYASRFAESFPPFRQESFLWILYIKCRNILHGACLRGFGTFFFCFGLPLFRSIIFMLGTTGLNRMLLSGWYLVVLRVFCCFFFLNHLLSYCLEGGIHVKSCRGLSGRMFLDK